MIGSMDEANAIWCWHQEYLDTQDNLVYDIRDLTLPAGWKFLGSGVYRDVYLSPAGVVYKIEAECMDGEANLCESIACQRSKANPSLADWIPDCHLYWPQGQPVIAMEHVPNDAILTDREHKTVRGIMEALCGVDDSNPNTGESDANVRRRPDGQAVIIDLGGYGRLDRMPAV